MKVLSTDGLTKLIQLVKSAFISVDDVVQTSEVTLATVATTGAYSDLSGTPTLATVATSGSYNDLSNKPTIPTVDQTYSATSTNAQSGVAVASAISTKADTDLSNVSATGKETAIGWGMPDYTAGVNLGEPTTYQILPCDCYVTYQADTSAGVGSEGFYYTNQNESYEGVFKQALTYNRIGLGLYLQKGWKVKRFDSSSTIIYYPLKGTQNV